MAQVSLDVLFHVSGLLQAEHSTVFYTHRDMFNEREDRQI